MDFKEGVYETKRTTVLKQVMAGTLWKCRIAYDSIHVHSADGQA